MSALFVYKRIKRMFCVLSDLFFSFVLTVKVIASRIAASDLMMKEIVTCTSAGSVANVRAIILWRECRKSAIFRARNTHYSILLRCVHLVESVIL